MLGEFRPGGMEREWCDAGVLRVAAPAIARRAAPRGRTGRRDHLRALPPRVAGRRPRPARDRRAGRSDRAAPGRRDPGVGARTRRAARAGRRLPAGDARRAVRGRRAGVGRAGALGADDGRVRLFFRDRCQCSRPGPARPPDGPCTTRSASSSRARARRSGPSSSRPRAPPTKRSCSPRSGISCGPARSRTTRSGRCACPGVRRARRSPRAGRSRAG